VCSELFSRQLQERTGSVDPILILSLLFFLFEVFKAFDSLLACYNN
jgi:hypothetical protein